MGQWSGQRSETQGVPAREWGLLGTSDPWDEEEEKPSHEFLQHPRNTQPLEKAAENHLDHSKAMTDF